MTSRHVSSQASYTVGIFGERRNRRLAWRSRHRVVEDRAFLLGKDQGRRRVGSDPAHHRHPEYAPADHAKDRDQIDKPVGCSEFRVLRATAGFEDFVKDLDLPTHGVPVELFDGTGRGFHRQVGDEAPVDGLAALRDRALLGMDDREPERRISLLLTDGWQHVYGFEADFFAFTIGRVLATFFADDLPVGFAADFFAGLEGDLALAAFFLLAIINSF